MRINTRKLKNFAKSKISNHLLFLTLSNLLNLFRKNKIFFFRNQDLIKVVAINEKITWNTHKSRMHLYKNGLENRGRSLGKSYLLQHIRFKDGDLVIDCGANMGDLQIYFKNIGVNIEYLGIEPNPLDFRCLELNLLPRNKALNIGLWDQNKVLDFYIDSESASSSFIPGPNFTEIILIEAKRLDDFQFEKPIKLLKVEGEGAEPEILKGVELLIDKIEYISVDVGPERGVDQTTTRTPVIDFLLQNKFIIVEENPYHRKTILFKNISFKLSPA